MILELQTPPAPGFDPNLLVGQLIPLFGAIVALLVGGVVLRAFFKSDLATAIAERIRAGMHRRKHWKGLGAEWFDTPGSVAGDEARVAQLEERVEQLQGQIAELAERLDFAERLLAQKRERTLRAGE
jgi:TolA-binding protein